MPLNAISLELHKSKQDAEAAAYRMRQYSHFNEVTIEEVKQVINYDSNITGTAEANTGSPGRSVWLAMGKK